MNLASLEHKMLKLLQAEVGLRKHRFQTQSGVSMPPSDFLKIPFELLLRFLRKRPKGPWMCRRAVCELELILNSSNRRLSVLELGGGSSTKWLLNRSKNVLSIETDPYFADFIVKETLNFSNSTLLVSELTFELLSKLDVDFDLVIIDFNETETINRSEVALYVRDAFPDAIICLDNSDRYPGVSKLFENYVSKVVVGLVRKPFCANQTTFFYPM